MSDAVSLIRWRRATLYFHFGDQLSASCRRRIRAATRHVLCL